MRQTTTAAEGPRTTGVRIGAQPNSVKKEVRATADPAPAALALTGRTIIGGAARLHHSPYRRAAAWAWLHCAVVNGKAMLEQAELTVGAHIIAKRRAPRLDRIGDHRSDRSDQPLETFGRFSITPY